MARSDDVTLIPLDRAAKILGIDPFHFNMIVTSRHPEMPSEDDIWFQFPYQHVGKLSRDDLAVSLKQAESLVSHYLGFTPIPDWVSSEEKVIRKPYAVELINVTGKNSRGQHKSVRTNRRYVISGGVKAKSLIEDDSAITYSDEDGDGYAETGSLTVVTTVTDPQEIRLFFPGKSGADAWEIRPIAVSIDSGTATITVQKYQIPLPSLWIKGPEENDPSMWRAIDGDTESNFLEEADVYRVYNDPSTHATFYNENTCASCSGAGCTACGYATQTGCLRVRDSRLGILSYSAATWDADTETYVSADLTYGDPDKMFISYYAGWRGANLTRPLIDMDPLWERAIVYYAYANMDRALPSGNNSHNLWEYLAEDMSLVDGQRSHLVSGKDLQNPLGTTRAAIQLWRLIERYQVGS